MQLSMLVAALGAFTIATTSAAPVASEAHSVAPRTFMVMKQCTLPVNNLGNTFTVVGVAPGTPKCQKLRGLQGVVNEHCRAWAAPSIQKGCAGARKKRNAALKKEMWSLVNSNGVKLSSGSPSDNTDTTFRFLDDPADNGAPVTDSSSTADGSISQDDFSSVDDGSSDSSSTDPSADTGSDGTDTSLDSTDSSSDGTDSGYTDGTDTSSDYTDTSSDYTDTSSDYTDTSSDYTDTSSDYSGADYSGADYSGSDYSGADYSGADYSGADYSGADYSADSSF